MVGKWYSSGEVGTAVWTRARGQGEEKKPDNIWGANDVFGGRPERMGGGNGMRRIDGRALGTPGDGHRAQAGGERSLSGGCGRWRRWRRAGEAGV